MYKSFSSFFDFKFLGIRNYFGEYRNKLIVKREYNKILYLNSRRLGVVEVAYSPVLYTYFKEKDVLLLYIWILELYDFTKYIFIKTFIILFKIIKLSLCNVVFRLWMIVLIQLIHILINPSHLLILPYIIYSILSVLCPATIMATNDPAMISYDFDLDIDIDIDLFNDCVKSSQKIDISSINLNSFSGNSLFTSLGIDNPFIEIKSLPSSSPGGLPGGSSGGLPGGSPGGLPSPGGPESWALVNQINNDNIHSEISDTVSRNNNSSVSLNPE